MYLKRLELKGFKSFADKSSVSLEPGISAIVGPNGSGKSNICDAILWVLGERNAKSLRGAVMEDVIFAGSTSRKAVNLAEVSLVLDNSDGTLPIEYNEVMLSRRLYRSGESEYLINNVPARRLDVLDILHDSGLGTDTNSIISQGHLDSILQSKPQDRRALIEEAAGVLKHKQRKLRSERKLERMDQNLQRIHDVMQEIERQLKPLRIKAKRAAAYDGLCERLQHFTLLLAVDDLKKIKKEWDAQTAKKQEINALIDQKRESFLATEQKLNQLREKIASQSNKIVEHAEKQRKLNLCIERFDAYALLMKEKATNAMLAAEKLSASPIGKHASPAKQAIMAELKSIEEELKNLHDSKAEVDNNLAKAKSDLDLKNENLGILQQEYDQLTGQQRTCSQDEKDLREKISSAQDNIVEAQAKTAAVNTRIENLDADIKSKKAELTKLGDTLNTKNDEFNQTQDKSDNLTKQIQELEGQKNKAQSDVEEKTQSLNDINASIMALEEILKSSFEDTSSATKWLEANKRQVAGGVKNLSDEIDVPDKYLSLVETLLGSYSTAFIAKDHSDVAKVEDALKDAENAEGSVRLVVEGEYKQSKEVAACVKETGATSLFDEVKNTKLGTLTNVVVFDTSFEAFKASKKYKKLICASLDGSIIYPDGRTLIGSAFYVDSAFDGDSQRTILSYKKNLKKLTKSKAKYISQLEKSQAKLDNANTKLNSLKEAEYQTKHKVAVAKAELDIANSKLQDTTNALNSLLDSMDKALKEQKLLKEAYSQSAPELEANKKKLEEICKVNSKISTKLAEIHDKLIPFRIEAENANQAFNQLVIEQTQIIERIKSRELNLSATKNRLEEQSKKELASKKDYKINKAIAQKSIELYDLLTKLSDLAKRDLAVIDKNAGSISQAAKEVQEEQDRALTATNDARATLEIAKEDLNKVNIELAKLEVQVQNAVDAIDEIPGITVDEALLQEDIDNREEIEDKAFKIKRRIENMGTINPDAKRDYDELKERYDFLHEQVEDLKNARQSLRKINHIIDLRMKDDFIDTFHIVDENFQEIFEVLFPGGHAHLELEDEQDVENSGVEVIAQPSGKRITKMSLMSGGEKSLVALCLLFAVYKTRTTPFYILDEVEAALDDSNLRRLINYLSELREHTQLIMITHQRRTMEMADVLYGVSMRNDGVTKVVSQKLEKK